MNTSIPAPASRQATAREFLAIVFRRRWVILGLFAATTLTVVALTLQQKAEYMSVGRVLVKRGEQESMLTPTRRVVGQWEEDLGSEVQLVKSHPVLERARELLRAEAGPGRPATPVDGARVDAEVVGKSTVLAIAYVDPDSATARRVCDAVIRAYLEFRQRDLSLTYPRAFFEEEIARVQGELDRWVEARRQFSNSEELVNVVEQQRALIGHLAGLEIRRSEAAADLAEARSLQQQLERLSADPNIDLPTFSQLYSNESALVDLKRRVTEQEAIVAQRRERYRDESPEVANALATLESLRAMLRREVEARIKISGSKVATLEARVAVFDREIAATRAELERMPDRETRIANMDRRISLLRDRLEQIVEKSDQARVVERTSMSNSLYLLAPAGAAVPTRTRDYVRLALAPAFSLVVGIGLAFFLDGLDLTVRTAGHAEEAADLPVLAAVNERRRTATR
uniref:Polysaccharide chain length determinant N-terminal domain-containing protein n=1 Tax=Eiseniibacteriota bacterium TaxID=2212470 RepID=A0A832MK29_UNCEI